MFFRAYAALANAAFTQPDIIQRMPICIVPTQRASEIIAMNYTNASEIAPGNILIKMLARVKPRAYDSIILHILCILKIL